MDDPKYDQRQVSGWLTSGIIYSVVWLAGIGSLIAVVKGIRARKAILSSNGALVGSIRAWWCILVGGAGVLIWAAIAAVGIVGALFR